MHPLTREGALYQTCRADTRQKNSAPFRFRGLRKSRENCTSAESFFLSETGASRGAPVSVVEGRRLPSPWSEKKDRVRKDALFLVARLRRAKIRFAQILGREYPIPSQARPMRGEAGPVWGERVGFGLLQGVKKESSEGMPSFWCRAFGAA